MNAEELVNRRKDRAIAIILRLKEADCDPHLPPAARVKLRKVILDQLNDFSELVLDIVQSMDDGHSVVNEKWIEKLDEMHQVVMNGAGRIKADR